MLTLAGLDQQVGEQQKDSSAAANGDKIRPGFTGIADISWLTQTDLAIRARMSTGRAQLFRPG